MEIATLEIVLRTDRAQSGAKRVRSEFKKTGAAATGMAKRTTAATTVMATSFARLRAAIFSTQALLLSLGVGIGLVQTINTLKDFEFTMAGVAAISGAVGDEFVALEAKARNLGATTIFSASEAAEGLRLLSLAGFKVNESLSAIDGTLALATAGNLGLGEASQITANIIRSFRLEAAKAGEIADILAKTATNANISVGSLGNAFSFVGAVARAAGQDVADTAAALGVLADAGFDSSRAGTGLRRVFGEILVQNDKLLARLPDLGLTFEDINLKTNSFTDVISKLAPLATDAAFALEVFGQRGGPAFLALVGQADRLEALNALTRDAGGAAQEIAKILTDTLQGSLKLLRSALEEAVLGATGFRDGLRSVADTIRGVITVFNGQAETLGDQREKFEALADNVRTFAAGVKGVLVGAIFLATKAFIALLPTIASVTAALLLNPFVLFLTGAAAAAAFLFKFKDTLLDTGDAVFRLGDLADVVFSDLIALIKDLAVAFGFVGDDAEEAAKETEEAFKPLSTGILLTIADLVSKISKGLRALLIVAADLPNIVKNFGELSDAALAALVDLENSTGPIGERAGKKFAEGLEKGLSVKQIASFNVALKSIERQAVRLGEQLTSLGDFDLTSGQAKELKLIAAISGDAIESVTDLAAEIERLGGVNQLTAAQLKMFEERIQASQGSLSGASGELADLIGRLTDVGGSAASGALDVIEDLNDQLKILRVFGEEAQFTLQALTEANLDGADASNEQRQKIVGLSGAVFDAKKTQDAYAFAIDNTTKPMADLNKRLEKLGQLLKRETISAKQFATAVGLTKLEIQDLNDELATNEVLSQSADLSAFRQGLVEASTQIGVTNANMKELGRLAVDELGTGLTEALRQPEEAGMILLETLGAIGDKIIEIAAQEILLRPLTDALSGVNSEGAAGGGSLFDRLGTLFGVGGGATGGVAAAGGEVTPATLAAQTTATNTTTHTGLFQQMLTSFQQLILGQQQLTIAAQNSSQGIQTGNIQSIQNAGAQASAQANTDAQLQSGFGSVVGGLQSAFSSIASLFGGGGTGDEGADIAIAALGAVGGVAGAFAKGGFADSPPAFAAFGGGALKARRFQAGGAADNIPALLNKREAVVPLTGDRAIPVELPPGAGATINFNISTPDAESFRSNQGQLLAAAAQQLARAGTRNN